MRMKIGDVARRAGVSVETVRYYERLRVISEAERAASGYRWFDTEAVQEVGFVKRAQELGFSLDEIRELLDLRAAPHEPADLVRGRAEDKLADIEAKIADLARIRDALRTLTQSCCGTGSIRECPILEALEGSRVPEADGEA